MISEEQMERAENEFAANAGAALSVARDAERALESYTYSSYRTYDPQKREELLKEYRDADYMAESRAWILHMIRSHRAAATAAETNRRIHLEDQASGRDNAALRGT